MKESFFEEEFRNDFLVTKERKKLWTIELELLSEFERVCKKYHLKYYADGGTLLGAVRHKGFIPWDDDIDIQMKIEDYKVFCKVAKKEFKHPYFFQSYETENGFSPWHAKLRHSNTTGCTKYEKDNCPSWNKGIFLDIFPLFHVPENQIKFHIQVILLNFIRHFIIAGFEKERYFKFHKKDKLKLLIDPRYIIWKLYSLLNSYSSLCDLYIKIADWESSNSKLVGVTSFSPGNKKLQWPSYLFDDTIELPFEYRTIRVPKNYDERLRIQYGDYTMEVRNASTHSEVFYDASTPYKIYLKEKG